MVSGHGEDGVETKVQCMRATDIVFPRSLFLFSLFYLLSRLVKATSIAHPAVWAASSEFPNLMFVSVLVLNLVK